MSNVEDKNIDGVESTDGIARAKLYSHLAWRGYIVQESDELGPVKILVDGMQLQQWERDSVDHYKGGRSKGKAREYVFRLVDAKDWVHE